MIPPAGGPTSPRLSYTRPTRFTAMSRLLTALFTGLAFASWAGAAAGEKKSSPLPHHERFIAIDDACGWPQVTLLPDGTLACLIWPHPLHGFTEGAAECWLSNDGGRLWRKAGVPVPHAPGQNRMNLAAGLAPDGSYVALVSGWDKRRPAGWRPDPLEPKAAKNFFDGANTLNPIPAVSRDGGRTWQQFPVLDGQQPSGQGIIPFGRIAPLPDGLMGVMLYRDEVAFFVSADLGATWRKRGQLSLGRTFNETTWLQLDNGDLFAASRSYGVGNGGKHAANNGAVGQHLEAYRSTDGGRTWTSEGALTLPMQHPADLTRLPDGRILLSYGVRNEGDWGINVRIGDAAARTWTAPIRLVDLEGSTDDSNQPQPQRDGGYPSTVVLPDGVLVTAYYSRGVPAHRRYHVGVVRWTLPATEKKPSLP